MTNHQLKKLQNEIKHELLSNILPFWINRTVDRNNGGFYGSIDNFLEINPVAPRSAVLITRILWTFSRAYYLLHDPQYLKIAQYAYQYLTKVLIDPEFGGVYWSVDYYGRPLDTKKQIYAQAFAIYGLSEYYRAVGEKQALRTALDIFTAVEKFAADQRYGGYYDAYHRNWQRIDESALSEKDLKSFKSMNTHLHILEAYSNLQSIQPDQQIEKRLNEIITVTETHIYNADTCHFNLYFNEKWETLNNHISYGHDIEGSWLLMEAVHILQDKPLIEKTKPISIAMAEAVYREGLTPAGSIINDEHDPEWWEQAEAVVGFMNAYELTRQEYYLEASFKLWDYINRYYIDHEHGEWYYTIDKNGKPSHPEKVGFWKCPYHNSRACYEMINRLDHIIGK